MSSITMTIVTKPDYKLTHPSEHLRLSDEAIDIGHLVLNVHSRYRPFEPPANSLSVHQYESESDMFGSYDVWVIVSAINADLLPDDRFTRQRLIASYFGSLHGHMKVRVSLALGATNIDTKRFQPSGGDIHTGRNKTANVVGPHGYNEHLEDDVVALVNFTKVRYASMDEVGSMVARDMTMAHGHASIARSLRILN